MKKFFSRKINIVFSVLILVLIGALVFFGIKALNTKSKVIVPDFSDKTQEDINAWCTGFEENPCTINLEYSDTVEKGKLIYQSIAADSELDDTITFIVSLGAKIEIAVPKVEEHTTPNMIQEWATKNGLTNINFVDENSETVDKGEVIRIEPAVVDSKDAAIFVYISKGKADGQKTSDFEVEYGKYIGLSVSEFEEKVKKLGLVAKHADEKDDYSSTVTEGKIVWHGSGSYVEGENIRYGLSKGVDKNTIKVTKGTYVGITVDEFKEAVKKLGEKGLTPTHVEDYDDYSSTVAKDLIVWHGSGSYEDEEKISYGICLGSPTDGIVVTYGSLLSISEDTFKEKTAALKLVANHNKDKDEYSDTVEKGIIIWHGSGNYVEDETINYGLSLGKQGKVTPTGEIVIKEGDYIGKTLTEFKKEVEELGLVANHRSEWDVKDASKDADIICRNGYGTYEKGENISYGLYVGVTDSDEIVVSQGQYIGKTYDEFAAAVKKLGLIPNHREEWDVTDSSKATNVIARNGYGTYEKGENISYGLYKGGSNTPAKEPEVEKVTVSAGHEKDSKEAFETYIKGLGLNPENGGTQYSANVDANGIIYSTGNYNKGSKFVYYVSLGKDTKVTVASHKGETEATFKKYLTDNGLVAGDRTEAESGVEIGSIISNSIGTFEVGESVNYQVSKGLYLFGANMFDNYVQSTYDGTKSKIQAALTEYGFTNITFIGVKAQVDSVGVVLSVSVNGNTDYDAGYYNGNVPIVVTICNETDG